jgi:hypothetical protein
MRCARLLLVPVVLAVGFGGLCGVVFSMRVMRRPFMIVGLVVVGRLAVMAGGVLVVFGSLDMMLYCLLGHICILYSVVPLCHSKAYS